MTDPNHHSVRLYCPNGNIAERNANYQCMCEDCQEMRRAKMRRKRAEARANRPPQRCRNDNIYLRREGKVGCFCEPCDEARRAARNVRSLKYYRDRPAKIEQHPNSVVRCPNGNIAERNANYQCMCEDCREMRRVKARQVNADARAARPPKRCKKHGNLYIAIEGKEGCQCQPCAEAQRLSSQERALRYYHRGKRPQDKPCIHSGIIKRDSHGVCKCDFCTDVARKQVLRSRNKHKDQRIADARRWREQNPDKLAEYNQRPETKGKSLATVRKRQLAKRFRTPAWADLDAIELIYQQAARLTAETGIKHEVDHIHPLQGRYCCGLHVAGNLQIMVMAANRGKRNACISCDPVWEAA